VQGARRREEEGRESFEVRTQGGGRAARRLACGFSCGLKELADVLILGRKVSLWYEERETIYLNPKMYRDFFRHRRGKRKTTFLFSSLLSLPSLDPRWSSSFLLLLLAHNFSLLRPTIISGF